MKHVNIFETLYELYGHSYIGVNVKQAFKQKPIKKIWNFEFVNIKSKNMFRGRQTLGYRGEWGK